MAANDDWIAAFQASNLRASPSPTLASGLTVVSLGTLVSTPTDPSHSAQSSSLAGVINSGEYGGVAKRAHLFSYDPAASLCLGFVGTAGLRFCIKNVVPGKTGGDDSGLTCGVGKHVTKFQPDSGCYYLRGNDSMAHCYPAFSQAWLPSKIHTQLSTLKRTNQEWKDFFSRFEPAVESSNADSADAPPIGVGKLVFKTPKKFLAPTDEEIPAVFIPSELRDIEAQSDMLSDENCWWTEDDDTSLMSSSLLQFLKDVHGFMLSYRQWLIEPHEIASNCLGSIEDDMHQLKKYCEAMSDNLGGLLTYWTWIFQTSGVP
jgi:hypothetical protein